MPSFPSIGNQGRKEGWKLFRRPRLRLRRDLSKAKQSQLDVKSLNKHRTLTDGISRKHHDSFPSSTITIDERLRALVQSAESFPVLKDLADSIVALRSFINHSTVQDGQKIFKCAFDILEAVAETIGDAMDTNSNPQISSGLSVQIEDLTSLFSKIQTCIASQGSSGDLNMLREQLDVSHYELVHSGRNRRLRENSSVVCREVLQLVVRSSDGFGPLKSVASGTLAIWDIKKRVSAIEPRARDLLTLIQSLDPGDGDTSQADVSALFSVQKQLERISIHRPFFRRLKRLVHDEDALRHAQVIIDHFCQEAAVRGLRNTSKLVEAAEHSQQQITSLQNATVLDIQVTSKLVETVERSQRQTTSLLVTLVFL